MHKHLNAREWLEAQRLVSDCEFIPELIDLLDDQEDLQLASATVDDTFNALDRHLPSKLKEVVRLDRWRQVEHIVDRLDLLDEIEMMIHAASDGMTWPNGTEPVDAKDRLEAMLDSPRWLDYDL
jgi:hypothetical protein